MSQFPPVRVSMHMDSGVVCQGEIFKQVLAIPVDGAFVQMWVKFDDNTCQDRYLLDDSITSFNVLHRAIEPSLFSGAPWA
jgi:hypothetical protein